MVLGWLLLAMVIVGILLALLAKGVLAPKTPAVLALADSMSMGVVRAGKQGRQREGNVAARIGGANVSKIIGGGKQNLLRGFDSANY